MCFCWPKIDITSFLCSNAKGRFQIRVYKINKEKIIYFSQFFVSVKVKKISGSNSGNVNKIEALAK